MVATIKVPTLVLPVASSALQYFSTLFHKRQNFRKKVIEHEMWVLIFSTDFSKTFFILRRIVRHMIKNIYWSSCKVRFNSLIVATIKVPTLV